MNNLKKKIKILDCTLRDGGYYNNWDFSNSLISSYLKSMSSVGVEYVEIGFRSFEKSTYRGACAYSRDDFINSLSIPRNLKVAVMVNASELINSYNRNPQKNIKFLFRKQKKSKIKLIRIACHYHELKKTIEISN